MYAEVYKDCVLMLEYEARRRFKRFICAVDHLANDDSFHVVSEASEAGVGVQTVSFDVKREVFSG